jgi:hypothetical protein
MSSANRPRFDPRTTAQDRVVDVLQPRRFHPQHRAQRDSSMSQQNNSFMGASAASDAL